MTAIDEIKARIDIVDLISETVKLRRSGKNYVGFCPFHPNTRTPAFVVFPETGTWRCFGQCNDGGDIFSFLIKKEGWDFPEVLRYLAERAGVQLRPPTPHEQEAIEEYDRLRGLLEEAVTFYRHQLFHSPAGELALSYLREKRGLKDAILEAFDLGYAPNAWDATLRHFISKGYSQADLMEVGLVVEGERGVYDRFRHRVVFPIRDERGRMAGFGARVLNPEDVPKFLNSPQTELFDKGRLLYGLDKARRAIRTQDQVVIVEGYLDVVALHQAGFANAVSPMGTALTAHQLKLLKRFTRRIVLALDADAAGDQATLRGLQLARETLDRRSEPVFDARGLLRHEARLQADIRVTTLPEGKDPDEVVLEDPAEWSSCVEAAKPIVAHVMDTLTHNRDLSDPKVKQEIATQVLPLIKDLPSAIERDTYRQRLARLLQVDERTLMVEISNRRPRRRRRSAPRPEPEEAPAPPAAPPSDDLATRLEAHCLGILLRRPDLLYRVDRALQEAGLTRLNFYDFQQTEHRLIIRLIQRSVEQDEMEPGEYVLTHMPLEVMGHADELLAGTEQVDLDQQSVMDDLLINIIRLRRKNLETNLTQIRYLIEDVQAAEALKSSPYHELLAQHIQARARLDKALLRYTHQSRLLD